MCQNHCRKLPGLTSLNSLKQSYEVAWELSIFFQIRELKHRKWKTHSRSHHHQMTEQAGIQMQATWWQKRHLLLCLLETIKANSFIWLFAGLCSRALQGWIHLTSQQSDEVAVTVAVLEKSSLLPSPVGGRQSWDWSQALSSRACAPNRHTKPPLSFQDIILSILIYAWNVS